MKNIVEELPETDCIVIGAGAAGLSAAISLMPLGVTILSKGILKESSASVWAQGGIAASVRSDDSLREHLMDSLRSGAGLCDPLITSIIVDSAPNLIEDLISYGALFDRGEGGELLTSLEGGHSRSRVIRARGDSTGIELIRALLQKARSLPHTTIFENAFAEDLLLDENGSVAGLVYSLDGKRVSQRARAILIAAGGIGQLYKWTTNPAEATGDGIALALLRGAKAIDLEFVQFHPTVCTTGERPFLLTEAIRGEGGHIINEEGKRFLFDVDNRGELASRDITSRRIWKEMQLGHKIFLDAAHIPEFPTRFPQVHAFCKKVGFEPRSDLIPITPAQHYFMGGILVDEWGRSSLDSLWVAGEAAGTGAHGANRLASNSLLEACIFGERAAIDIKSSFNPFRSKYNLEEISEPVSPKRKTGALKELQNDMWMNCGVVRNGKDLNTFEEKLRENYTVKSKSLEERNAKLVALGIAKAALLRKESRGAHFREDFPDGDQNFERRQVLYFKNGEFHEEQLSSSTLHPALSELQELT